MALDQATERGIAFLIRRGVITEEGLRAIGELAVALENIGGNAMATPAVSRRGRPRKGAPARRAKGGRAKRGSFTSACSDAELKKLYVTDGMTAKEIAAKFGVSPGTVSQRAMKLKLKKNKSGKKK